MSRPHPLTDDPFRRKQFAALEADNARMRDVLRRIWRHVSTTFTPGSSKFEHWEYGLRVTRNIIQEAGYDDTTGGRINIDLNLEQENL